MIPRIFEGTSVGNKEFVQEWYTEHRSIPYLREIVDDADVFADISEYRGILSQIYCDFYLNGINGEYVKALIMFNELVGEKRYGIN